MSTVELKKCPFCGSDASLWTQDDICVGVSYVVECDNPKCGCSYGRSMSLTQRQVVNRWNRRFRPITVISSDTEALEAMEKKIEPILNSYGFTLTDIADGSSELHIRAVLNG